MKTLHIAIGLVGLLAVREAQAGPPFVTDDPEPVEYLHGELYLATQHARTSDGWAGFIAQVEFNYGIMPDAQLHVIAPLAYDAPIDGNTHIGYGDTEVGAKFRFIQETENCPQVGIFPLLEIPTGAEDRNLGSGHIGAFFPLWLQKSWGTDGRQWTTYGGGGYHINPGPGNRNWTFTGLVLQRQVTDGLLLGVEVFHRTPTQVTDKDDTAFNIAAAVDFSDHHHLLLSVGRSIDGPTELQVYTAYQLTFGVTGRPVASTVTNGRN